MGLENRDSVLNKAFHISQSASLVLESSHLLTSDAETTEAYYNKEKANVIDGALLPGQKNAV